MLFIYPSIIIKLNNKTINSNLVDVISFFQENYFELNVNLTICDNNELIVDKQETITCFTNCIIGEPKINICIDNELLSAIYERGMELSQND
jgi:hypothetical protein